MNKQTFAEWLNKYKPNTEKRYNGQITAVLINCTQNLAYRELWNLSDYFVEAICGPYVCMMEIPKTNN